jgi:site-specific recombinase XerD
VLSSDIKEASFVAQTLISHHVCNRGGFFCLKNHELFRLTTVAKRAKLDPEKFWLHKFRATFASWALWAGVDLRTVQQWLGHTDLESTMRYLKPSRSQQVREKVNQIFAL